MDNVMGGMLLALIGLFLGMVTYKQSKFFWDSMSTRILRKYLGDAVVSVALYIVSAVLVLVGVMLAAGLVR
ncbi:MAG: hypothetical protein ACOYER_06085 [Limnochordia bacterium]